MLNFKVDNNTKLFVKRYDLMQVFFSVLSAVAYLFIIFFVFYVYFLSLPPANFPKGKFLFELKRGESVDDVASKLQDKHMIKSELLFKIWMRLAYSDKLQAGDYLFSNPENLWTISRRFANGEHGLTPVKIRIQEGWDRRQIAKTLEKSLLKFKAEKFLDLSRDKEGYLFPDTYYFLPNITEQKVLDVMLANFYKKIAPLSADIEKSNLSLDEIVKLASLVEKEASNYKDRRMIAGVLLNRLKIDMPLQVDATWIYTHGKGTFGITLKELKDKNNPYNTYVHKGLPPTAICSPSLSSIKAVIYPENHNYIFYLADSKGNTYYSKTYKEHLRKKRIYIGEGR